MSLNDCKEVRSAFAAFRIETVDDAIQLEPAAWRSRQRSGASC
jgi:hypothetical protein